MKSIKEMSMEELAAFVCEALEKEGIETVLSGYYHWDDGQSLDQAIWVAQENIFNMDAVKSWSKDEGMIDKFKDFEKAMNNE